MREFQRFMFVAVVAAMVTAACVVDAYRQMVVPVGPAADSLRKPDEETGPIDKLSWGPGEMVDSLREPVVVAEVSAGVREEERGRRAQRPENTRGKLFASTYDEILAGSFWKNGRPPRVKPAEPMPPTACRSVEPAPQPPDHLSGPHRVHDHAVGHFENVSGFGFSRMFALSNDRGIYFGSPVIDRVELVSLLTDSEPSVYVFDEMATPALARQAKRRPLDEFEQRGLDAIRRGEHLVWTREAPTRMFGAIRARVQCLECHANAKRSDLLGAFTYYLTKPVDQFGTKRPAE